MEREFEAIEPNIWKPEKEEDQVEGLYLLKKENVGPNGSTAYYFQPDSGGQVMVWGCIVLDNRMLLVKIGDYLRITYKGKKENAKKQKVNIYKVERQRDIKPDVFD